MTAEDSDISLFSLPLLSFSLSRLSFFPVPSFARSALSRILLPDFSHTLPVFSVFPPRFCWFTALFLSFPLAFSLLEKHIPPIRRTLTN